MCTQISVHRTNTHAYKMYSMRTHRHAAHLITNNHKYNLLRNMYTPRGVAYTPRGVA